MTTQTRTRKFAPRGASAVLALAILIPFASPAMATTATGNLDLTASEQSTINAAKTASETMSGSFTSITIPDTAARAKAAALGFDIDLDASLAATNSAIGSGNPTLQVVAAFDETRFNAASEYGNRIDMSDEANYAGLDKNSGEPVWFRHGLAFANGDFDDHQVNISTQAAFPAPEFPAGLINPRVTYGDRTNPSEGPSGFNPETGAYVGATVFPSSSYTAGGVPDDLNGNTASGESTDTQTWIVDRFAASESRTADASLNGAQRASFDGTFSDCISTPTGKCGMWLTPIASGLITNEDGSTSQGTVQIMEPIWIEVTTTVAAQAPAFTEANPFVAASGDKVFFSPVDEASKGIVITSSYEDGSTSQSYNLLNPGTPIVPWSYNEEEANAGLKLTLDRLGVSENGDGGFNFVSNYSSPFYGAQVSSEALPADTTYVEQMEAEYAQAQADVRDREADVEKAQADYDAAVASGDEAATDDAALALESAELELTDARDREASTKAELEQARADAVSPGFRLTYDFAENASYTPGQWLNPEGIAYAVGETFSAETEDSSYLVDFTVQSNEAGRLVVDALTSSTPPSEPEMLANRAEVGTGASFVGGATGFAQLPGYEMKFVLADPKPEDPKPEIPEPKISLDIPEVPKPEIPEPEIDLDIPEVPVPEITTIPELPVPDITTITEEKIPEDTLTEEGELPEDSLSDGLVQEDLADTGADSNKIVQLLIAGGALLIAGLSAIGVSLARKPKDAKN